MGLTQRNGEALGPRRTLDFMNQVGKCKAKTNLVSAYGQNLEIPPTVETCEVGADCKGELKVPIIKQKTFDICYKLLYNYSFLFYTGSGRQIL